MSTIAASETPFYGVMNAVANAGVTQWGFVSGVYGSTVPADNTNGWLGWDMLQCYVAAAALNRYLVGFDNSTALTDTDQGLHKLEITGRFDDAAAGQERTMVLPRSDKNQFIPQTDGGTWTWNNQPFARYSPNRSFNVKWYRKP